MLKKLCAGILATAIAFGATGIMASADIVITDTPEENLVEINEYNFSDDAFRAYISENIDTDGDGYLSQAERDAVTEIDLSGRDVKDLYTGNLGFFEKIEKIDVSNTPITEIYYHSRSLKSINVTGCTELKEFDCCYCSLSELDVSTNTALVKLFCYNNELTELDVSNNAALEWLDCYDNKLTELDVSNNTALIDLVCYHNELTELDVSNNAALKALSFYGNNVTKIDLSKNTELEYLTCMYNGLTELDVSKNTALINISCYSNAITELDVSNNAALKYLDCSSNVIEKLDVSKNTKLESLQCNSNAIAELDVSNNTALMRLECGANKLTALDVGNITALEQLWCDGNNLTELDVSNNTSLIKLSCTSNALTKLDVSKNTDLEQLQCYDNDITELDVTNNLNLIKAYTDGTDHSDLYNDFYGSSFNITYYSYKVSEAISYVLGYDSDVTLIVGDAERDENAGKSTTLTDSETDITVTAAAGVLPEGVKLNVTPNDKTDTRVSYDITLTDAEGNIIQPNGKVSVSIPVPEGWPTDSLYVYRVEKDGTYTNMKAKYANGYVTFETDHFSVYILTTELLDAASPVDDTPVDSNETDSDKNTNPATGATAGLAFAGIALAGMAVIVSKKNK